MKDKSQTTQQPKKKHTLLLDQHIQRAFQAHIEHIDEKSLAMAIKTLLQEEKDKKTLH
ncbi:MAG: hypothetical protein ACRCWY_12395 [Cellulosilyticaceae bacterium]